MKRQASILISGTLIGALCGEARAQVGLDPDAVLVLEVQHADRTPVIDGLLGDWSTTRFIPFGQNADHISDRFGLADDGSTEPEGTALTDVDFSGSVALMWDEDWIYNGRPRAGQRARCGQPRRVAALVAARCGDPLSRHPRGRRRQPLDHG